MRFAGVGGLYQKGAGISALRSGVSYGTQPADIQTGVLYLEVDPVTGEENIFKFVRISATCTIGNLLYYTGTGNAYVVNVGTGLKPAGVSLISPTASGTWTFMQTKGRNTTVSITATVGALGPTAALYGGGGLGGSAAVNLSSLISLFSDATSGGTATAIVHYIGKSLTVSTTSTTLAFIDL